MSDLALQRIAEAKKSKATSLDLGNSGLTEIPEVLFELDWLEELSFSDRYFDMEEEKWVTSKNKGPVNHLRSIDGLFTRLPQLEKLILGDSEFQWQLDAQHINHKKIPKLKSLQLQGCSLQDYSFLSRLTRLTSINISRSTFKDYSFLSKLPNLTSINLGGHRDIKDYSFLSNLPNLTSLFIWYNDFSDFSLLSNLTNLTHLDLYGIYIKDCLFLSNLTNLTILDLGLTELRDGSSLSNLTNLTILDLFGCDIKDCSFLSNLTNLTHLDLGLTELRDGSSLSNLTNLTHLKFYIKEIGDLSFLSNIANLTSLSLSISKIEDLSILSNLTNLTRLQINNGQIIDFSFLFPLTALTSLCFSNCNINDISFLSQLTGLTYLRLKSNQISDISFLSHLTGLTYLDLSNNQISDISFLSHLTGLTYLDLSNNQITDVSFLSHLTGLTYLNLRNNQITDISNLFQLPNLRKLDVYRNQIISLPSKILQYNVPIGTNGICVFDNPIDDPPIEVIKQGREALEAYFSKIANEGIDYLYESKLLILGEGGAGKTTLCHKLLDPDFDLNSSPGSTEGIDVYQHRFTDNKQQAYILNIWDFGGQQIYHATHQFFLTKRSLYALVVDERKEDTDLQYWLNIVDLLSDGSPLIIVQNEKEGRKREADLNGMRDRFKNIKEISTVDFADNTGLSNLTDQIEFQTSQLKHIGTPLPKSWVKIRNALLKEARHFDHIEFADFIKICDSEGLGEYKEQCNLSAIFHDLGVFLHYIDNPVLKHLIILNPEWATDAVYNVLDHDVVKEQKKGRFNQLDLQDIWSDGKYEKVLDELLELMMKFELCYQIEDSPNYIAPQLLSPERPGNLKWLDDQSLVLKYEYDFMPKGIMTRFIVRMHELIKAQELVWKTGVVLSRGNSEALVTETYASREILVKVTGKSARELMTIIVNELDKIHRSFPKLKVNKQIPCNCKDCAQSDNPNQYDYEDLKRRKEKGKQTVECKVSYQDVEVLQLLDNFFVEYDVEQLTSRDARNRKTKMLIASSSELGTERKEIIQICDKVNKMIPGQDIETIKWETAVAGGSTGGRVQDPINEALKKCDVVLVIIHSKVGEFTLEEFKLGHQLGKKLFVYFKKGFSPETKEELAAYKEVLNFKGNIEKSDRCIVREYDTIQEFENTITRDLHLHFNSARKTELSK